MNKLFCYSYIDWFWIKNRPQHIPEQLSKYFDTTYFSTIPLNRSAHNKHICIKSPPSSSTTDFFNNEHFRVVRRSSLCPKSISHKLHYYTNRFLTQNFLKQANIIEIMFPLQYITIAPYTNNKILWYDCMDSYEEYSKDPKEIRLIKEIEPQLIEKADIITITSESLLSRYVDRYRKHKKKFYLSKNAFDEKIFNNSSNNDIVPDDTKFAKIISSGKKIAMYVGLLSDIIDWNTIVFAAESLSKEVDFVFIGPLHKYNPPIADNIFYLGQKPHTDLPNYLKYADVALIPHLNLPAVSVANPVKIYEYLGMGLNIISSDIPEVRILEKDIKYYDSKVNFTAILKELVENKPSIQTKQNRFYSVQNDTWSSRAIEISKLLYKLL